MVPATIDAAGPSLPEDGRTPYELNAADVARSRWGERERSRIVMVDPHPYSAEGLRVLLTMLTDDLEVVAIVPAAEMVLDQICLHSANLLVIEPRLPGTMSVIKAARELSHDIRIVALTTQEDRRHALEVIRRGAHAYISKQIEPEELICVLRVVRAGRVVLSGYAAKALAGLPERDPETLSAQDRKLLEFITEGMDNGEIARRLAVSESTLKRNIRQLLKKLNARNKTQAAVRAASNGLLEEW